MNPDRTVFRPRYPLSVRVLLIGLPIFFVVTLLVGISVDVQLATLAWMVALVLGISTSVLPFLVIRQILFLDELILRRHFLPDEFVPHADLVGLMDGTIQFVGRRLKLGPLMNADELTDMLTRWSAAQVLKQAAGTTARISSLYPSRGYGSYAGFWGLVLSVIVMFLVPPDLSLDPRWTLAGTFLILYLLYIYIFPKIF